MYGYPYLKHLIKLWPGDWENQMERANEVVGTNNCVTVGRRGKRTFVLSEVKSPVNVLVVLYHKLPIGGKYRIFRVKYQNFLVR